MSTSRADHPPNLVWDWSVAALGALYALPAAVVALSDTQKGIALAVGGHWRRVFASGRSR